MKNFHLQDGIGRAKYTISYHNGEKTHKDGSPFYDIEVFRNKKMRDSFIRKLESRGYKCRESIKTG